MIGFCSMSRESHHNPYLRRRHKDGSQIIQKKVMHTTQGDTRSFRRLQATKNVKEVKQQPRS